MNNKFNYNLYKVLIHLDLIHLCIILLCVKFVDQLLRCNLVVIIKIDKNIIVTSHQRHSESKNRQTQEIHV